MKTVTILMAAMVISACAGRIETRSLDPTKQKINGVVYYAPTYAKVSFAYRTLVDAQGKVVGAAPATCRELLQKEEVQIMPDFARPYVVDLTGGALSANKLAVTLSSGMLASVNGESTPQVAPVLTSILTPLATVLAAAQTAAAASPSRLSPGPDIACNAGPGVVSFTRIRLDGPSR